MVEVSDKLKVRVCNTCFQPKLLSDFRARYRKCKDCLYQQDQARPHKDIKWKIWYASNKDKLYYRRLKYTYGLDKETYLGLLADQNFKCKICHVDETTLSRKLHVDHCHKTGKIRGLLCSNCNTSLGLLKESPSLCLKIINYLQEA